MSGFGFIDAGKISMEKFMKNNFFKWNTALNWTVVFTAFALPFSKPLIYLGLILIFLFWILEGNWKNKWNLLKQDKLFWIIIIFLLFTSLSVAWSQFPEKAIKYWLHYVKYFIFIPILYTSVKKSFIPVIISSFLIAIFISEIISYGISFGLWETEWGHKGYPTPFMHHIQYSIFLASAIVLIITKFILKHYGFHEKIFLLIFLITAFGNLFLNVGRTGQLSAIIAVFSILVIYYRKQLKHLISTFLFFILLLTTIAYISPNFSKRIDVALADFQKIKIGNYDSSLGMRFLTWKILLEDIISNHIIVGGGIGSTMEEFKTVVKRKYSNHPYLIDMANAHNQYIQILASLGIVGFIIFIGIFYFMFFRQFENQEYFLMLIGINTVFLVSFIFNTTLIRAFPFSLFIILNGTLLANSRPNK